MTRFVVNTDAVKVLVVAMSRKLVTVKTLIDNDRKTSVLVVTTVEMCVTDTWTELVIVVTAVETFVFKAVFVKVVLIVWTSVDKAVVTVVVVVTHLVPVAITRHVWLGPGPGVDIGLVELLELRDVLQIPNVVLHPDPQ